MERLALPRTTGGERPPGAEFGRLANALCQAGCNHAWVGCGVVPRASVGLAPTVTRTILRAEIDGASYQPQEGPLVSD